MSFNFYKWVMSLLKIDKTKGKEFVLDSITMENIPKLPECQSFNGIYIFLEFNQKWNILN